MGKRNYRKRREAEDGGVEEAEDGGEEEAEAATTSEAIEERRELQKFRKRPSGVSAVGLALGKKLQPDEEVISDPFKLKTGGLVQVQDLILDRERDREGEDREKSINLGANFAAETNRRDEDTHMLKYIEEEIAKKKGVKPELTQSKPKTKEDLLYEVPKHIDVKSKIMRSEEMMSSQMLSGIPEVNLGIEAKMRNIEATEEARQRFQDVSKKRSEPTVMVPTNVATNFLLHNRFYDEQKNVEAESKKAAAAKAAKEVEKPKAPAVEAEDLGILTGEDAVSGAVAVPVSGQKRKPGKTEKASDDFFYEKFKKRARDSWRYQ